MITESESPAYFDGSEVDYPLGSLPISPSTVLEIGSGAGSGALQVLTQLPDASLTCLEPDDSA